MKIHLSLIFLIQRLNKSVLSASILSAAILLACEKKSTVIADENQPIEFWTTAGDQSSLLQKVARSLTFLEGQTDLTEIVVDTGQRFQSIDGFGYTLTGGSSYLLQQKLTASKRSALLNELFSTDDGGIGVSYLRLSIGASDLDDHVFSYNDLQPGETDPALSKFSLEEDRKHLIPVLKEILAINPDLKIMGSPWSAPAWMKTNNSPKGGSLKKEYYATYANYLVKYVEEMAKEGIPIDAITIQNEPENPNNNPSMVMTASEQGEFIKDHLGPVFALAAIKTKIIIFDHNCDHPEYPIVILDDAGAKKYIDGSAFHLYLGDISALSQVHEAHSDKNIYFTEQWTSSEGKFDGDLRWHVRNLIVGATRNWSRTVLEWNLAADPQQNPHTDRGGCTQCLGALTIGDSVTRNVSYYVIAHASKFVKPGSVRIASTLLDDLPNVAFVTPRGKRVLIVLNDSEKEKQFAISFAGRYATVYLHAGSVGTLVW
jgi:glucosylceramidase